MLAGLRKQLVKINDFKVVSINTLEHVSFHDCIIEKFDWEGDTLNLYFDWLDIHKTHPDNQTGKAKRTSKALDTV